MNHRNRVFSMIVLALGLVLAAAAAPVQADPCLTVYQTGVVEYHYDPSEYYTVTPGHPLYDPAYDRGGQVLIDANTNEIDQTIYQAPGLAGFVMSTDGKDGYFSIGHDFNLIVDGWSNTPTTYTNILVVIEPEPPYCTPTITIDGNPALYDPGLGWYYPVGDLVVSTPTADGNNYSDTAEFSVHWDACSRIRLWAFADENFNLVHDGQSCFSAYSHDLTVPVEETSWGAIKKLYND